MQADSLLMFGMLIGVLLLSGAVAGFAAGLLGVGGGIVLVPVLFHVFEYLGVAEGYAMHLAVGTSLATIIPTSIRSGLSHYRSGSMDLRLLKSWLTAILVGVVVGVLFARYAPSRALSGVFGVVALMVAARLAFSKDSLHAAGGLPAGLAGQVIPFSIGGISSVMGIGGGTLGVPTLTSFRIPIRKAVATSAGLGLIISIPGTLGFMVSGLDKATGMPGSLGFVNLIGFAAIVPTSILLAPYGVKVAHSIKPQYLRIAFGVFLLATAIKMLHNALY